MSTTSQQHSVSHQDVIKLLKPLFPDVTFTPHVSQRLSSSTPQHYYHSKGQPISYEDIAKVLGFDYYTESSNSTITHVQVA